MTERNDIEYPTLTVILTYALLGGACGGTVMGIFLIIIGFAENNSGILIAGLAFFCAFYGFFIGFIPALITGVIIAMLKITKNGWFVAVIGGLTSGVFAFATTTTDAFRSTPTLTPLIATTFIAVGAISAVLIGKLILPKATT